MSLWMPFDQHSKHFQLIFLTKFDVEGLESWQRNLGEIPHLWWPISSCENGEVICLLPNSKLQLEG